MLKSILAIDDAARAVVGECAAPPAAPDVAAPDIVASSADCRARADVYRLLSGVFVEEPSREFLLALRQADTLAGFAAAGLKFDADFLSEPVDSLLEALAIEYATNFAASGGFPPVESVRLMGRYNQEPNFDCMQAYQRLGFVLSPGRFEVFADQLGIELMFIAELLERSAFALERNDLDEQHRLEKEIRRFWAQHLGRWVRGYCRLVERTTQHSFYREMARFLGGFAAEEIEAMHLRVEDVDHARLQVPKSDVRVEFNPNEPVCNGCVTDALSSNLAAPDNVRRLEDMRALADLR